MNREFVNIKVDREERPDVDRVYMTFVQATTGHGGWPMSVWLTPELKPFVGGTYFPPEDRLRPAGIQKRARNASRRRGNKTAKKFRSRGRRSSKLCAKRPTRARRRTRVVDAKTIEAAYQQIARSYDAHEGGFGGRAEISAAGHAEFSLSRLRARSAERDGKHALEMNLFTLRKMAAGGMHDHLGGGFHALFGRRFLARPAFRKNALRPGAARGLLSRRVSNHPRAAFENVARDVLDYVRRDMTAPDGGFYSAEDADSLHRARQSPSMRKARSMSGRKTEIDRALGAVRRDFQFPLRRRGRWQRAGRRRSARRIHRTRIS